MIRILVLDAYSGGGSMIGKATLQALVSSSRGRELEICAAVQDPSQLNVEGVAKQFTVPATDNGSGDGADAAAAANNVGEEWSKLFENFHRILVVTPKIQDPVPFTKSVLQAASKMDHLELLLMTSNTLVGTETAVGLQCSDLEDYAKVHLEKKSCIVRVPSSPLFIDHLSVYGCHIREHHSLLDPRDPNKPFWSVAVGDVANACTTILTASSDDEASGPRIRDHQQQTYHLVSTNSWNLHHLASLLSKKLEVDRPIETTRVSYENTKLGMLKHHSMPEWQVDSVLQLFKSIDEEEVDRVVAGDVERITGIKATSLEDWIDKNISQFQ